MAQVYADFLDRIVIAPEDENLKGRIEELGIKTSVFPIRMDSLEDKRRVARELLTIVRQQ
ncbi:MAG TPA: hypothetical protein DCZ05_14790 [Deltaproteobacteria bacterium]|nr:hypothetical protein [Deltaproteobacteria bacterium]